MKINILAIVAHPDDAELGCGGTLALHKQLGYTVGIIDLTHGELGTRGTEQTRKSESKKATEILGLDVRVNLNLPDGFIENRYDYQDLIIKEIRKYQPDIIITNAKDDRHPDHFNSSKLVKESAFKAGLSKIITLDEHGKEQEAWRPNQLLYMIQYQLMEPDIIVDISTVMEVKMDAIKAYATQFYNPNSEEPKTLISSNFFLKQTESRNYIMGNYAKIESGEGFLMDFKPSVSNLFNLK